VLDDSVPYFVPFGFGLSCGWRLGMGGVSFFVFFRFPVSKIDGASGGSGLWAVVDLVDQVPTWRLYRGEKGLMLVLDRVEG
jgi:hypothetical protein